jgi:hypothetical protein
MTEKPMGQAASIPDVVKVCLSTAYIITVPIKSAVPRNSRKNALPVETQSLT